MTRTTEPCMDRETRETQPQAVGPNELRAKINQRVVDEVRSMQQLIICKRALIVVVDQFGPAAPLVLGCTADEFIELVEVLDV